MRPRGWLVGAGAWSTALLVAALVVPMYGSTTARSIAPADPSAVASETVAVNTTHATLVQVNGVHVLVPMALPLLAVVTVAVLRPAHRRLAWAVTALLLAFCLAAMLSVGIFVLPAVILLVVACSRPPVVAGDESVSRGRGNPRRGRDPWPSGSSGPAS
jgi:hypothetical protein